MSESGAGEPEPTTRVPTMSIEPPPEAAPQAESKPPESSNGHTAPPNKPPPPKPTSPSKPKPPSSSSSSSCSSSASATVKSVSSSTTSTSTTKTTTTPAKPATAKPPTTAPNGTPKPVSTVPKTTTTTTPTTKPAAPSKPAPPKPTGTPSAKPTSTTTTTTTSNTPKSTTAAKTTTTTTTTKPTTATTTPAKTTVVKKEGETNGVKKEGEAKKEEAKTPVVKKEAVKTESKETKTGEKKEAPKKRKKDDESDDDDDDDSSSDSSDEEDSSDESDTPLEEKAAVSKAAQPAAKRQATTNKPTIPASKPVTKKVVPAAKAPPKKKPKAESESDDESSSSDSSSDSSDSDSSDSSDSDDDEKKPTKRKQEKKARGDSAASSAKVNNVKNYEVRDENVALKAELGANKWWNRLTKKHVKWNDLIHNGPRFPPPYVPHGVPLLYDGTALKLSANTEEVATFYASMLDTDFMNKPIFKKNFFRDWRAIMTESERSKITSLEKCSFSAMQAYITADRDKKKEEKKLASNKSKAKEEKEMMDGIYGFARVDGYLEKVGNYRVEPPSLFRGRGEHPKTGMLKRRVRPEDVVINIGKGVKIPRPPEGHTWKGIVHNNKVTWLAFWQDNINKDFKYVYLSATSRFKGESDIAKYAKAQTLIKHIGTIRKKYNTEMTEKDRFKQQLAVALYALDVLALRVGNEKDTDNRADTVGLCSLRVEHITFPCPEEHKVRLNFLGKDSMVYDNTVVVPPAVYDNLVKFTSGKGPKANLFEKLEPAILNDHLKAIMPGLSAKVFRTYNASITLEQELEKGDIDVDSTEAEKIHFYNKANTTVAILCNHQRTVPKAHAGQMEKIEESLGALQKELKALNKNKKDNRAKIVKLEERIEKKELQKTLKSATATVALGTSKINYMDPRVTVAWCKKVDLPLEKVFNASLVTKFPWAMEVPSTWKFDPAKNPTPKQEKQEKDR